MYIISLFICQILVINMRMWLYKQSKHSHERHGRADVFEWNSILATNLCTLPHETRINKTRIRNQIRSTQKFNNATVQATANKSKTHNTFEWSGAVRLWACSFRKILDRFGFLFRLILIESPHLFIFKYGQPSSVEKNPVLESFQTVGAFSLLHFIDLVHVRK